MNKYEVARDHACGEDMCVCTAQGDVFGGCVTMCRGGQVYGGEVGT